jgi:hypothetical protein
MLLNSRHPMFLWWGPELIRFTTTVILPSFGHVAHPTAMIRRRRLLARDLADHSPSDRGRHGARQGSWNENHLVPIYRNDCIEEVYWTWVLPVSTTGVIGVLVVCTETTAGVLAIRRLSFIRKLATAERRARSHGRRAHHGFVPVEPSSIFPSVAASKERRPAHWSSGPRSASRTRMATPSRADDSGAVSLRGPSS